MVDVLDVGQYIYDKLGWVDSWKLQKLTYYVEAWSLAWDGKTVFENDFEAWPDGPVSRKLFRENKYSAGPMARVLPGAETGRLSERDRAVIDAVLDFYGSKTKRELIDATHLEQPWNDARGDLPATAHCTFRLSTPTMRSYYTKVAVLGEIGPTPPAPSNAQCVTATEALRIADNEATRWRGTLDWLATR